MKWDRLSRGDRKSAWAMFNRKSELTVRDLHRKSEEGIGRAKFNRKSEVQSEVESSSSAAWYTISINQDRKFLQSDVTGGTGGTPIE
ncbi:hypothetical protein R6Q59_033823 [Mikania micrantha]